MQLCEVFTASFASICSSKAEIIGNPGALSPGLWFALPIIVLAVRNTVETV
jgi:hypothetical protein